MRDERIRIAVFVCMDDHAGRFVREEDMLILIHHAHARRCDAAECLLFFGYIEVFVVQVQLHGIALGEFVGGLGALVVHLDALQAKIFVHHAAG